MTLSRLSKYLFLFFSTDNPLWKELIAPPITQQKIAEETHVSQSTLSNWKRGASINLTHLEIAIIKLKTKISGRHLPDERIRATTDVINKFWTQCSDPELRDPVYTVAKETFSMTIPQCQKIIDEIVYENYTIFPSLSYSNKDLADEIFRRFSGIYFLYVRRNGLWLKCPLRVRYVLALGTRYLIRCKLNAPVIGQPKNTSEYDGFLRGSLDENAFWKFEKRDDRLGADFFDFITQPRGDRGGRVRTLVGAYLTTGQDTLRSIEHDDMLVRGVLIDDLKTDKDASKDDEEIIADWMHNAAMELSKDATEEEWNEVNRLWRDYGPSSA